MPGMQRVHGPGRGRGRGRGNAARYDNDSRVVGVVLCRDRGAQRRALQIILFGILRHGKELRCAPGSCEHVRAVAGPK